MAACAGEPPSTARCRCCGMITRRRAGSRLC